MTDSVKVLDHGFVTLIPNNYSDLTFVNAAKVSFDKQSSFDANGELLDKDARLIKYLITHNHWTPFAHAMLSFELRNIRPEVFLEYFIEPCQMAQFRFLRSPERNCWIISGSYYAWIQNARKFGDPYYSVIHMALHDAFPQATAFFLMRQCPFIKDINDVKQYINDLWDKHGMCNDMWHISLSTLENDHAWYEIHQFIPATLNIQAPIAIRTQLYKSKIGLVENEVSRRYVSVPPLLHIPVEFRAVPEGSIKQGSGEIIAENEAIRQSFDGAVFNSMATYNRLIEQRVCPEQARFVLPQGAYTNWWWTGYLSSFARVYALRSDPHAQIESQQYASAMDVILGEKYGDIWKDMKIQAAQELSY